MRNRSESGLPSDDRDATPGIEQRARRPFALTLTQEDIYLDQIRRGDGAAYNVGGYIALDAVDADRLRGAHARLVRSEEIFGLRVRSGDDGVRQWIEPSVEIDLPYLELAHDPDPQVAADEFLREAFERPFDLEGEPLFRAWLIHLGSGRYRYAGMAHHIAMDGWSFANWAKRLSRLYADDGDASPSPGAWEEHVAEDRDYAQGRRYRKDLEYWLAQRFEEVPSLIDGRERIGAGATRSHQVLQPLPKALLLELDDVARRHNATLPQMGAAALAAMFARTCDRDALVIGLPVHNRRSRADREMLGVFTGINPMRVDLAPEERFCDVLKRVSSGQKEMLRHQRFPIGHLARELQSRRRSGPLYEIGFNFLRLETELRFDGDADLVYLHHGRERTPAMFTLWYSQRDESVELQLDCSAAWFGPDEAERLAKVFVRVLDQIASDSQIAIGDIDVLLCGERERLLESGRREAARIERDASLHALFEAQRARTPGAVAVEDGTRAYTYDEVDELANAVADALLAAGVAAEEPVAVCLPRTADMLIALLGVLKSGAAYVPLDPEHPSERRDYILLDSGARLAVVDPSTRHCVPRARVVDLTALLSAATETPASSGRERPVVPGDRLAYLIYTSGSTGKPKAVMIEHRSAVALIAWASETFPAEILNRTLCSTSLNFDLSVFELFVPISLGHRCVIVRNILDLLDGTCSPTLLNTVPSSIRMLLDKKAIPSSVRAINLAGERLTRELRDALLEALPGVPVYNLYGPSETTTYSTWRRFDAPDGDAPSIGAPIAGTDVYVLDRLGRLSPPGAIGELHIGGCGVARGYHGRPELTARMFLPDPFAPDKDGGRMYRTGDLVRWRSDNELEYMGRRDHQVKIRGHRIEPGEIEDALLALDTVADCVVTVYRARGDEQALVAYVVASDGRADPGGLRDALRETLPAYMVPAEFVFIDRMPLNANGKVDRAALPAPAETQVGSRESRTPPETELQTRLHAIVARVLDVDEGSFGIDDDFFAIGGHSLLAVQTVVEIRSELDIDLPLRAVFERSTVRSLAIACEGLARAGKGAAIPTGGDGPAPMSSAQQRLWFLDRLQGGSPEYHMTAAFRIVGTFLPDRAERALRDIVQSHEALRTVFRDTETGPEQIAVEASRFALARIAPDSSDAEGDATVSRFRDAPFDLERDLPMRAALIRCPNGNDIFAIVIHHIVCDGWSVGLLVNAFQERYRALSGETPARPVEPSSIRYMDYARWQQRRLADGDIESLIDAACERLRDAPQLHGLPLDRERPEIKGRISDRVVVRLPANATKSVLEAAHRRGMTPFMLVHAAASLVLARHANAGEIVMGTPMANRLRPELGGMIGLVANLVALRVDVSIRDPERYLAHVRDVHIAAQEGQEAPFDVVVDRLRSVRSLSHAPVFQILLTMNAVPALSLDLPGADCVQMTSGPEPSKFDIDIDVSFNERECALTWVYDASLFAHSRIETFAEHLATLLPALAEGSADDLGSIPMFSPQERRRLLHDRNATGLAFRDETTIDALIAERSARSPDEIALRVEGRQWTYRELDVEARLLAEHLTGIGTAAGDIVGLYFERSFEMVAAMLALLKCGAAYLPLDPHQPQARTSYMVEDSRMGRVLTHSSMDKTPFEGAIDVVDVDLVLGAGKPRISGRPPAPEQRSARDLAYVIYTSGSTGRPKGVKIEHRALVNRLEWMQNAYPIGPGDRILQKTPYTFDVSVWEFLWPLMYGATLVMARPEGHKDPEYLTRVMHDERISVLHFVPSMLAEFLRAGRFSPPLRLIFCSGEALAAETARRTMEAAPEAALHNLYGPTEAAIDVSHFPCGELAEARSVPIGKPIQNIRFYVVNDDLELVPDGCQGELLIGGIGLARGYLNRPELTAERFVPDPFGDDPGERLYRTGDTVSWRGDGQLEYWGRRDGQVKLRGFRIELGEIETRIASCTDVDAAAVVLRECGPSGKQLVAYVIAEGDPSISVQERTERIRSELRAHLPDPMLPAHYVFLDEFPHTPSGKIDRQALPPPELKRPDRPAIQPSTALERDLGDIWADVLGIGTNQLDVDTDFFEIGGHSLLAIRMVHAAKRRHALDIPLQMVFRYRTLRELAAAVEAGQGERLPALRKSGLPAAKTIALSATQSRIWLAERMRGKANENNVCGGVLVRGEIDVERTHLALTEVMRRHPILTARIDDAGETPMQTIGNDCPAPLTVHDLRAMEAPARKERASELIDAHAARRFDLSRSPLCDFLLVRIEDEETLLYMNMHHLTTDGWSLALFIEAFLQAYAGEEGAFAQDEPDYADYVRWQADLLASDALQPQIRFWRTYLDGAIPGCRLPQIVANAATAETPLEARLSHASANRLRGAAMAHGGSIANVLHAALSVLIARLSGQSDLLIGLPVSGRHVPGTERMLGALVNVLPARSRFDPETPFDALLLEEIADLRSILSHQDVPYERIAMAAGNLGHEAGGALFDVVLNVLSLPQPTMRKSGLSMTFAAIPHVDSKFGLAFYAEERDEALHIRCTHLPSFLSGADAAYVLAQYAGLLESIAEDASRPCGDYALLPATGQRGDARPDPSSTQNRDWPGPVQWAFAKSVDATPTAIALSCRSRRWTYAALERAAATLARSLRERGVGKGDVVAILARRNDTLVVATLATLMAGGAFMMLSEREPEAHRSALLLLARPRLALTLECGEEEHAALTDFHAAHGIPTLRVSLVEIDSQEAPATAAAIAAYRTEANLTKADDVAYIAYTSGSQGVPKPVVGRHSALTAYAPWFAARFGLDANRRFAMLSGLTHDPLQRDMFTPLMSGGSVHVPGDEDFRPGHVASWMSRAGIDTVNLTPSLADFVFAGADAPIESLRAIFMVGEPLSAAHIARLRRIAPNATMVNLYGATETCRALAFHVVDEDERPQGTVPVGRGVADVQLLVLTTEDRLCSPGEAGEICIRSPHMSLGYLGDAPATARRFAINPSTGRSGDIVYRTGDRGHYLDDGQVICAGRIDRLVKIRGFRVEPGAVEAALRECADVDKAAVDAIERDGRTDGLAAWIVLSEAAARGEGDPVSRIRSALRATLPVYAVPSTIAIVDDLPLTPSGKVDRMALRARGTASLPRTIEPARTETEKALVPIWRTLLGHEDFGVADGFFDIGGHSLLAVRLLTRIEHDFGVKLEYGDFFDSNSIRSVAERIDGLKAAAKPEKRKMTL